jgi:hypothetical protein
VVLRGFVNGHHFSRDDLALEQDQLARRVRGDRFGNTACGDCEQIGRDQSPASQKQRRKHRPARPATAAKVRVPGRDVQLDQAIKAAP